MSFLEMNLGDDIKESEVLETGEYDLTITDVDESPSKNSGKPMITCQVEPVGFDNVFPIPVYLSLPNSEDTDKARWMKQLKFKRFLSMAGVPFDSNGFEVSNLLNATFTAMVEKVANVNKADGVPTGTYRNELQIARLEDAE